MRLGRIKNAIEFPFVDGPGVPGVFIEEAVDISGGSSEGFESFTERIALALQLLPDIALDGCARRPDPALFVDRVSIPQAAAPLFRADVGLHFSNGLSQGKMAHLPTIFDHGACGSIKRDGARAGSGRPRLLVHQVRDLLANQVTRYPAL